MRVNGKEYTKQMVTPFKSEYIMWTLVPVMGGEYQLVGIKSGDGYTVFDYIGTIDEMAPLVRELNERDNPKEDQ